MPRPATGGARQALQIYIFPTGGGGEIRTHDTVAGITVFKTVPFNRSGTPPTSEPTLPQDRLEVKLHGLTPVASFRLWFRGAETPHQKPRALAMHPRTYGSTQLRVRLRRFDREEAARHRGRLGVGDGDRPADRHGRDFAACKNGSRTPSGGVGKSLVPKYPFPSSHKITPPYPEFLARAIASVTVLVASNTT